MKVPDVGGSWLRRRTRTPRREGTRLQTCLVCRRQHTSPSPALYIHETVEGSGNPSSVSVSGWGRRRWKWAHTEEMRAKHPVSV